jgi:hypothetical protein
MKLSRSLALLSPASGPASGSGREAAPRQRAHATEDVRLVSGREIKKGERVALLFIPANMERERFGEDADRFNPHRDTASTLPWGMSFGSGAHSCPGRPLVTGSRSRKKADVDGTMVTIARRLYDAGMQLDTANPPVADETTLRSLPDRADQIFAPDLARCASGGLILQWVAARRTTR